MKKEEDINQIGISRNYVVNTFPMCDKTTTTKTKRQIEKAKKIGERNESLKKIIEKNKIYNCCPNNIICCSCKISSCCCRFTIFYHYLFILSLLLSVGLHIFDVGSDIYVLFDLYSTNLEFFFNCLGIMILSFFASSVMSLVGKSDSDIEPGEVWKADCMKKDCKWKIIDSILGLLQLSIFVEVYHSIDIEEKTHTFIWSRVIEAILESCPQSLFQLFVVLKNVDSSNIIDLTKYYMSISISLINLAIALVVFEIYRYEYERRKRRTPITGIQKLTIFSPYGIVLTLYRITEVCSRIGLLGCLGYFYDGRAILIAIAIDYVMSISLCYFYNYLVIKSKRCDLGKVIFITFNNLLLLPAYWKPFTSPFPSGVTDKEYYEDIFHWVVKYINNIVISVLVTIKILNNSYHTSVYVISIGSMVCFIASIFLLYFIILWNRDNSFSFDFFYIRECLCRKKNYKHKFKSYSLSCNCCCINYKKSIENINSEISRTTSAKIDELNNNSSKEEIII